MRDGGLCELAIGRSMVVVHDDGATESNIACSFSRPGAFFAGLTYSLPSREVRTMSAAAAVSH